MKPFQLEDLTSYHRKKVLDRAFEWRRTHHPQILELLKAQHRVSLPSPKPAPPEGAVLFDPPRWEAHHWEWFSLLLIRRMGTRQDSPNPPELSSADPEDASPR